jgi:hypothetical protein
VNGGSSAQTPAAETNGEPEAPKIHLPDPSLGREEAPEVEAPSANGEREGNEQPKPKKKTRRGSRGGRRRRKPAAAQGGGGPAAGPSE